jgi:hypothetical protein
MSRGHDPKRHEARENRAVPARHGPSPTSSHSHSRRDPSPTSSRSCFLSLINCSYFITIILFTSLVYLFYSLIKFVFWLATNSESTGLQNQKRKHTRNIKTRFIITHYSLQFLHVNFHTDIWCLCFTRFGKLNDDALDIVTFVIYSLYL